MSVGGAEFKDQTWAQPSHWLWYEETGDVRIC